jgi:hypothetical protein
MKKFTWKFLKVLKSNTTKNDAEKDYLWSSSNARKFYEKLINVLKVIGFYGSKSDPCLWTM